jgi:hypothetical protein
LVSVSVQVICDPAKTSAGPDLARRRSAGMSTTAVVEDALLSSPSGSGSLPVTDAPFSTDPGSDGAVPVIVMMRSWPTGSGSPAHST